MQNHLNQSFLQAFWVSTVASASEKFKIKGELLIREFSVRKKRIGDTEPFLVVLL